MRTEDLDGLTEKYPDCLVLAYADIGTGVTLLTNSDQGFPREALDELCGEAALSLGDAKTPPIGMQPCAEVIKADDTALFVYLRAPDEPADALIAMCRHDIPLAAFLEDARACMAGGAA